MTDGVVIVAYGENARRCALRAFEALRRQTTLDFMCISDKALPGVDTRLCNSMDVQARLVKLNLDNLSPFDLTLYMDADTEAMEDIGALLDPLRDGWDMVIAPSTNQGGDIFVHIRNIDEVSKTLAELQNWLPLQLQAGVMGFRKSPATLELFRVWREEWARWHDQDQAAMLRALDRMEAKPRIWLLSNVFNGGEAVKHYFGQAR